MASIDDRWYLSGKKDKNGKPGKSARHGEGSRWRARFYDAQGKQHTRAFGAKSDAQAWLDSITTAKGNGASVDPRLGKMTVAECCAHWVNTAPNHTPTTRTRYAQILRTHIEPRWSGVRLDRVVKSDLRAWTAEMTAQGLAPATVRKVFRIVSASLAMAVDDGRIARNPATVTRRNQYLPVVVKGQHKYLASDVLEALAARVIEVNGEPSKHRRKAETQVGDRDRLVVLVLGYCGLRYGELAALRVRSLDLKRSNGARINVTESVTEDGGRLVWGTPKDHEIRSVPIPRSLADELRVYIDGMGRDDLLFAGVRSGDVMRNRVSRRGGFDRAAASMVDQNGDSLAGLKPHELRDTAASLAVHAGANIKALSRMLGHASAAMTLDTYADLFDGDLDELADALDGLRLQAVSGPRKDYLRTESKLITFPDSAQTASGQ